MAQFALYLWISIFLGIGIFFLRWEDRKKWYLYVGLIIIILTILGLLNESMPILYRAAGLNLN